MNGMGVVRILFHSAAGNAGILWVLWTLGGFSALESQTEMMVQNFVPFC